MAQRQFRSDDTSVWGDRYGTGKDGALTVSGNTTFSYANASCSGAADGTSLTLDAASTFADGDLVLIHQTRGTGAGNWELNKISSGGGTTSLTLGYPLINTYTDSGASQAQIIELKEYTSVTVNGSVTLSAPSWDGNKGGFVAFLCTGLTTVTGTISAEGRGFNGGSGQNNAQGWRGEGTGGATAQSQAANGNGGGGGEGGGDPGQHSAGGGGGGHVSTAADGSDRDHFQGGGGGIAVGNAALTSLNLGGGGGGGSEGSGVTGNPGSGGNGGGVVAIFSEQITVTGSIIVDGNNASGATEEGSGAGGGAAGSVLLKGQAVDIGSSLVLAIFGNKSLKGSGGNGADGSDGTNGRIHIDYSQSLAGSANPGADSSLDTILNDLPQEQSYTLWL